MVTNAVGPRPILVSSLEAYGLAIEAIGNTAPDHIGKGLFAMDIEALNDPIKFDEIR